MSSTAETATGKTSLADAAKFSELRNLGWTAVEDAGTWTATSDEAGETVGPAASMAALHTMVMLKAGPVEPSGKKKKIGSSKLEAGEYKENGQPILTGTENAVLEDMTRAGVEYRMTTMEVLRLQALQKSQKESCMSLMHKFQDELATDPDTKEKYFTVEVDGQSVDIVLAVEEKEILRTRVA